MSPAPLDLTDGRMGLTRLELKARDLRKMSANAEMMALTTKPIVISYRLP